MFLPRHKIQDKRETDWPGLEVGADRGAHKSSLPILFDGGDIRIMRQKWGQPCSAAEQAQAEETRDALVEYLFLALFIASSGSESEIGKAADWWVCPCSQLGL